MTWDAVVVGGGAAGLSAALWLGRYRRRVLVLDNGQPRNQAAWGVHGYPGLQDPSPHELRDQLRRQAEDVGARVQAACVSRVAGEKGRFTVSREEGSPVEARRVLLAHGRIDRTPDIPGFDRVYGSSAFHCPDCDGPSVTGARVGVLGHDRAGAALALYLLNWADAAVLLPNGKPPDLSPDVREVLDRYDVPVIGDRVTELVSDGPRLTAARLAERDVPLDFLFFHWGSRPSAPIAPEAGCECGPDGDVVVDPKTLESTVPGLYAAGDITGHPQLAIVAAAQGVQAALAMHRSLLPDDWNL